MPVPAGSETSTDSQPFPRAPDWDGDARGLFRMVFGPCLWYARRRGLLLLKVFVLLLLLAAVGDLTPQTAIALGWTSAVLYYFPTALVPLYPSFHVWEAASMLTGSRAGEAVPRLLFISTRPIARRRTWKAVTSATLLAGAVVYILCATVPYGLHTLLRPTVSYGEWFVNSNVWDGITGTHHESSSGTQYGPPEKPVPNAEWVARTCAVLLALFVVLGSLLVQWLGQFNRDLMQAKVDEWGVFLLPIPCLLFAGAALWYLTQGVFGLFVSPPEVVTHAPWRWTPTLVGLAVMAASASRAAYASAPLLEERKRAWGALWAMAKAWAVCAGVLVLIYGIAFVLRHTGQVG